MIKLSIIVPVYNVEEYLNKCVESILSVVTEEMEVILVDDGSTDSSGKICDTYQNYDYIKIIHKSNGGLSDARNIGLENAEGEYVWYVDSDDTISFDYTMFKQLIEKYNPEVICANYDIINNGNKKKIVQECLLEDEIYSGDRLLQIVLFKHQYYVAAWKNIFKREFLNEHNLFFRRGILHEDEQLTPFILLKAQKVIYFNFVIYHYYIRENSITNCKKWTKNIEDIFSVFYENADYFVKNVKCQNLKIALLNDIIEKMIYHINKYNVPSNNAKKYIKPKFMIKYSYGLKSKMRVVFFVLFPKGYHYVFLKNEKRK